jgi:hypothetical protein
MDLSDLKARLAEEAAKLGGQAVIIGRHGSENGGTIILPIGDTFFAIPSTTNKLVGRVIVFRN